MRPPVSNFMPFDFFNGDVNNMMGGVDLPPMLGPDGKPVSMPPMPEMPQIVLPKAKDGKTKPVSVTTPALKLPGFIPGCQMDEETKKMMSAFPPLDLSDQKMREFFQPMPPPFFVPPTNMPQMPPPTQMPAPVEN